MSAPSERSWADHDVILTGASQGIGRALALELAARRARLILVARTADRLEQVAQACRDAGADAIAIPTDITEPDQCERMVERAMDAFGRVDALINNAGISVVARFDELEDLSLAERAVRVNYLGALHCTRAALRHLKVSRGRIAAVASLSGRAGVPLRTIYAASKHAMVGFFDSLRIELKSAGVSVTVAYPDFVRTEVTERVFGPKGEKLAIHAPAGTRFMMAEECARRILDATLARKRDVILSARGRLGKWLQVLAPWLVDRIAARAMEKVTYR